MKSVLEKFSNFDIAWRVRESINGESEGKGVGAAVRESPAVNRGGTIEVTGRAGEG